MRALTTILVCLIVTLAGTLGFGCSSEAAQPVPGATTSKKVTPTATKTAPEFPSNYYFPNRPRAMVAMEGRPAPALTTAQWYGDEQDPAALAGKVVVVDFWATWCGPCIRAIPHNVELVNAYAERGLVIIGLHDSNRGTEHIPLAIDRFKINYPVAVDSKQASVRNWNIRSWPCYFVIDRKGTLRAAGIHPGAVEDVVVKLLDEEA